MLLEGVDCPWEAERSDSLGNGGGQGDAYRVLEMFYFLIWVLVTWVCWFMKLYRLVCTFVSVPYSLVRKVLKKPPCI